MKARNSIIAKTLGKHPETALLLISLSHEGRTDGLGYHVDDVIPGRGLSSVERSSKRLSNGVQIQCRTYYPGPYDGLAGLSTDIEVRYRVWVGWEEYNHEFEALYDAPPIALPAGAIGWWDAAFDGPRNWFAAFDDPELAEAFAASLPEGDYENTAPLRRD